MDSILKLGIIIVVWLQSLGGWLEGPMKFFSVLGYEQFYLLAAPILFWSIDPGLGLRIGLGLMMSGSLNYTLKLALHGPRPYWYDPRVIPLGNETSFGAPSGHAENAAVFWGLLASWLKGKWAWLIAILLMLLIGVSRLFLGMHFPSDVLIGWAAGVVTLWLMIRFEGPVLKWVRSKRPENQILIALAVALAMIALTTATRLALGDWTMPGSWLELAKRVEGAAPTAPLALSGVISTSGTFFGLAAGAILLAQRGWMSPQGTLRQRLLRYLVGLAGVILLWYGLDQIFPPGEAFVPYLYRFVRYTLIGLWVTYLAPLVFFRFRLATESNTRRKRWL